MRLLSGKLRHYDWGSVDAIPNMLGIPVTGQPVAEYWLGAHPSSPGDLAGIALDTYVAEHPESVGENVCTHFAGRLPFLMKILSAARPLSLQAHPNLTQAIAGFDLENAKGVALDAPERTYKDPWDKPELIIALTEFDALVGFRPPLQSLELFEGLGVSSATMQIFDSLRTRPGSAGMAELFLKLLIPDDERREGLVDVISHAVAHAKDEGPVGDFARTAVELDEHFPNDPSLLAALLLNRVHLTPGQGAHLAPGTMHAYISGTGIEVLGNSDNVLRGGLTSKYIDPVALVEVVDFTACERHPMNPISRGDGLWFYPAEEPAFAAWRLDVSTSAIDLPGVNSARILLVTAGEVIATDDSTELQLSCGQAAWIEAGEKVKVTGDGQAFLTATGLDA